MAEQNVIDWNINPFRADRWYAIWAPAVERALAFGATSATLTRSEDNPLHFRQVTVWEDREAFTRYWTSDELSALRAEAMNYYQKPVLPNWYQLLVTA